MRFTRLPTVRRYAGCSLQQLKGAPEIDTEEVEKDAIRLGRSEKECLRPGQEDPWL